jgi:RNA polymerase sigma factor (sigma-70 family)
MSNERPIHYCWQDFVNNGNRDAYYTLYRHYYAYLSHIGLKRGISSEVVKDGINDVFLYFWEKREQLQHIQSPHNYIVTFFIRNIYRTNKAENISLDNFSADIDYAGETFIEPSFETAFFDKESQEQVSQIVHKYLNRLPEKQRQIVYQKFYLGLSYAEIAKTNGLSVNTVYNTVYNAMHKLRTAIPVNTLSSVLLLAVSFCMIIFLK